MTDKQQNEDAFDPQDLRRRAMERLAGRRGRLEDMPSEGIETLIHELEVHQIELEVQNEELRRTQYELAEALERYRDLFDRAPVGYLTLDGEGKVHQANQAAAQLAGRERDELEGRRLEKLVLRPDRDRLWLLLRTAAATGLPQATDFRLDRQANVPRWVHADVVQLPLTDGAAGGFRITLTDITARKKAEELAEQRLTEIEDLYRNAPVGLCVLDRDLRYVTINDRLAEINGIPAAQHLGRSVREILPALAGTLEPGLQEVLASGKARLDVEVSGETPARPGVMRSWREQWLPLKNAAGHVTGISLVVEETTERKAAQQALLRNEARWNSAIETFREGAIIATEEEQVIYWNPAARAMHGFENEGEGIGPLRDTPLTFELWTPDGSHLLELDEWPMKRIKRGEKVHDLELRVRRPDQGWEKFFSYSGTMVETAGGERLIFLSAHDLTQQRMAELALRQLNDSLERRIAERTREVRQQADQLRALANDLSQTEQRERQRLAQILHDNIQQLLVAARMQLSLLKHGDPAIVRSAIQGVDSILSETLAASRSLTIDLCPPVLHQSGLASALTWLAGRLEEKQQFKVHVHSTTEAEPASPESRSFVFEAVREMLLNTFKHSGVREAYVTMMRTQEGSCRIIVEDKGRGFDPNSLRPGSGSGFGLFSIQQRLLHMRGNLEIESAPGRGTRAVLTVPIGSEDAVKPMSASTLSAGIPDPISFRPRSRKITILLVDDHQIMRQGLSSLLQFESDMEVVAEAENGKEAVELSRRFQPDVVIMDVNLPVLDGIAATRTLTKLMPQIKVVGLSMHMNREAANAMREAGAVAYLTKGVPSEDLIATIRACVAHTRSN